MLINYNYPTIKLFDEIFGDLFENSVINSTGVKTPIHDVIETDKEYIVEMLMAGLKKKDIDIGIEKDMLTIKAERKEINDIHYNRKESYFGKYERVFNLPDGIDRENISALLVDGILKIVIPKTKEKKIKKKVIEIK